MAKKLGTIFVEIGIDSTQFSKAQKDIIEQSTSTSLQMEKNFKTVGTQSDLIFNAMKTNITNSLDAIVNRSKSSTDEIARAQQAAADKISAINKQQFGAQESLFQSFKNNWVAASVVIYAAMETIRKGWETMKMAAEYSEQKGMLDNLALKYKTTADNIINNMERASDGMISRVNLMKIATAALGKGLSELQITNLTGMAEIFSRVQGVSKTTALEDIAQSLESGRMRGLKAYTGATIDLKGAFGDLAGKMTDAEKALAMYDLTMIQGIKLQEQQKMAVDDTMDNIERLEAKYKNLMLTLGQAYKTMFVTAFSAINSVGTIAEAKLDMKGLDWMFKSGYMSLETYKKKRDEILSGKAPGEKEKLTVDPFDADIKRLKATIQGRENLKTAPKFFEKDMEAQRKALDFQVNMQKSTDAVLLAQMENQHKLLNMSDEEYYQKKTALIEENKGKELTYLNQQYDLVYKTYSVKWDAAKSDEERSQATSQYKLQLLEIELKKKQIIDKATIDSDNNVTQEILKQRELRLRGIQAAYDLQDKAETHRLDMFKISAQAEEDTAKYLFDHMEISETQFYEGEIERIKKSEQAEIDSLNRRELAFRSLQLIKWDLAKGDQAKEQEILNASESHTQATNQAIEKLQADSSNKIVKTKRDEVDTIYKNWVGSSTNWATEMRTLSKTLWSDLTSSFSSSFYDIITGKWDDLGNVWKNFCDQMLKAFADMLARMLVEWLAKQVIFGEGVNIPISLTGSAVSAASGSSGGLLGTLWTGGKAGYNYLFGGTETGGGAAAAAGEGGSAIGTGLEGVTSIPLLTQLSQYLGLTEGTISGGGSGAVAISEASTEAATQAATEAATTAATEAAVTAAGESSMSGLGASSLSAYTGPIGMALMAITNYMAIQSSMNESDEYNKPQNMFARAIYGLVTEAKTPGLTSGYGSKNLYKPADTMGTPGGANLGHPGMTISDLSDYIAEAVYSGSHLSDTGGVNKTKEEVMAMVSEALGPANAEMIKMAEAFRSVKVAMTDLPMDQYTYYAEDYTKKINDLRVELAATSDPIKTLTDSIAQSDVAAMGADNSIKFLSDSLQLTKEETAILTDDFKKANDTTQNAGDIAKSTTDAIDILATMLGIGADSAKALAEALGLIPRDVSTTYSFNTVGGGTYTPPNQLGSPNYVPSENTYTGGGANTYNSGANWNQGNFSFHDGGIIMHSGGAVPPWYANLKPDERRIIGQTGEGMVSRKGMAALDRINSGDLGGGGNPNVNVKVYIGNEEFDGRIKIVTDGHMVDRNQRGIDPTQRIY